ncbi:MAG: hypothetical protein ACREHD_27550, partial [Pirellulales bacterium]
AGKPLPVFASLAIPDSDFWNHDLVKLAEQIDSAALAITDDEKDILERLSKFVAWAGRYPMPSRPENMLIVEHSTLEYFAELDLWERLFNHLQAVGWWIGTGKRRLPFNDNLGTTLPQRATSYLG